MLMRKQILELNLHQSTMPWDPIKQFIFVRMNDNEAPGHIQAQKFTDTPETIKFSGRTDSVPRDY
jgi:hypothetical protein